MKKDQIMKLADGEAFVTRDSQGVVRMITAPMTLRKDLGDIDIISKKPMITKDGYMKINRVAGVNLLTPPSLIVDGIAQSNPHIEKHPTTKTIQSVSIRRIGIGYNPIGNLMAIDKTLYFNIRTYFIQDLQSKMNKFPACAVLGQKGKVPKSKKYCPVTWKKSSSGKNYPEYGAETDANFNPDNMVFYEIEDPVGIWVDISHPEIQALFDTHTQRQKFGDRIAQSIVDRNILKDFTAISQVQLDEKGNFARIVVYGHKHDMDFHKLDDMSGKIAAGEVDRGEIEHRASIIDVEVEEVHQAEAEEAAAPEEASGGGGKTPTTGSDTAPAPTPEEKPSDDNQPAGKPKADATKKHKPKPAATQPPPESSGGGAAEKNGGNGGGAITEEQKQQVIEARDIVGIDSYRRILASQFKVKSACKLTAQDADKFLKLLNEEADQQANGAA